MKRKYYLRGLGFGILITAIVFILVGPSELTDAEVIERAEALGYVKADEKDATPTISLKDLLETGTPAPTMQTEPLTPTVEPSVEPVATPTEVPVLTETPIPTETPAPTETPTPTETPAPTETPMSTEIPIPTEIPTPTMALETEAVTAQITVERGDTASVVCRKIQQAGIISNAEELSNYIVQNGMADYINIGTYTLSANMTFEEIIRILTGR